MAVVMDEGSDRRRRWAQLGDAQKTAIVFSAVSVALAINYLILQGFYLAAPAGCDVDPSWTEGRLNVVAPLGVFSVFFGIAAGMLGLDPQTGGGSVRRRSG